MRVWQVDLAPSAPRVDGIAAAVASMSTHLRSSGIDVRVVSSSPDASVSALLQSISRPGARHREIIHFHSLFRPRHDAIAVAASARGVPYVVSPHSALAAPGLARRKVVKHAWLRAVGKRLLGSAAAVCCLSDREVSETRSNAPDARTVVVRNPLPPEILHERDWQYRAAQPNKLLLLARWDVLQKGLDHLADLARHLPDVDVEVHGEADANEPERIGALLAGAPPNFALRPPVFGPAKFDLLRSATMYIAPSRWEGLSMSLLEALALGVPVAVSRYVGGTVPADQEGLALVLDDDTERAATQIGAALSNRRQLDEWSAAGRRWAREHCAPTAVAQAYAQLYEDVLSTADRQSDVRPVVIDLTERPARARYDDRVG